MAETNMPVTPEDKAEIPTTPAVPDIVDTLEDDTPPWETPAPDKQPPTKKERGSNPPKDTPFRNPEADKPQKAKRAPRLPKGPKEEKQAEAAGGGIASQKEEAPPSPAAPEPPAPPKDATRPGETEQIVYISHGELFPFKNHPFQVRNDEAMQSLIASVKERGVDQPAIVRPRENGGFEIVAGHRRQQASELAGYLNVPCVVRSLTDDEAVLMMAESNFNQRAEILPSERAKALKMQLDAIKHQGTQKHKNVAPAGDIVKRSNEVVAERNKMAVKQTIGNMSRGKMKKIA